MSNSEIGIRRGIVIDNNDPEYRGRCKIFVPGIYPNEFSKTPNNLPWAEPAMGIFGGGWKSNNASESEKQTVKAKFEETGICSVPHAGINGDGAQVWVFFDANDIRRPVYFAVAQTGPGWFSKHNNQHAIITDNVKIIIDEYNNYNAVSNKNDNISDELASQTSNRPSADLKNDITNAGGVSGVKDSYDGAGGTSKAFDFISKAGGNSAIQQISNTCSNGLNSLSNFIGTAGGASSFQNFMSDCGGYENMEAAMSGQTTAGATTAKNAIISSYGSIEEFQTQIAQIGGISGLKSITESFGGNDQFFSALDEIGGNNGLSSLAGLESKLGGADAFKEWNDGFDDGADSVNALIDGKKAEDKLAEVQQQSQQKEDDTIIKSDTYTSDADGYPLIKAITKQKVKTRLKIQVEGGENIAVDLNVKGDVNMKIDGNLYREVTGNVYDTILGDHHIYRKKGLAVFQDGDEFKYIKGKKQLKVGQQGILIWENGYNVLASGNVSNNFSDAIIEWKLNSFSVQAKQSIVMNAPKIDITAPSYMNIKSNGSITIDSDTTIKMKSLHTNINSSVGYTIATAEADIYASAGLTLRSDQKVDLYARDSKETPTIFDSTVTIFGMNVNEYVGLKHMRSIGSTIQEIYDATATVAVVTKTITGSLTDTVTINRNMITNGIMTDTIAGARTLSVGGTNIETIAGLNTLINGGGNIIMVTGDDTETYDGLRTVTTTGAYVDERQGATTITSKAFTINATGAFTATSTGAFTITSAGILKLMGTASVEIVSTSVVKLTGSAGSVTFTGAKTTVVDTSTGTGGSGTFAIVG